MIQYVRHDDIDRSTWDRRLLASGNATWYGLGSTLDAAAPGWDALIDEATGAQLPIPWRRKFGITYAYQPFLIQQLGPFAPNAVAADPGPFLTKWPKRFLFSDVRVGHVDLGLQLPRLVLSEQTNHVLPLTGSIDELRAGYHANHRRSLRKYEVAGCEQDTGLALEGLFQFLEGSEQFARWGIDPFRRATMRRIMRHALDAGQGTIRAVHHQGEVVAAAFFVEWGGRLIFLKGISSARGRELRAMHGLIDRMITDHAGRTILFDLAGGNDPHLARFYAGFGALPELYARALINRLPIIVRKLKQ